MGNGEKSVGEKGHRPAGKRAAGAVGKGTAKGRKRAARKRGKGRKPGSRNKGPRQIDRAARFGIQPAVVTLWKQRGVDIWDDQAMLDYAGSLERKPKGWTVPEDLRPAEPDLNGESPELPGLGEIAGARTFDDARRLKVQLDAVKAWAAGQKEIGEQVARADVQDDIMTLAAQVNAEFDNLENFLPGAVVGLTEGQIQAVMRGAFDKLRAKWHGMTSEMYREKIQPRAPRGGKGRKG